MDLRLAHGFPPAKPIRVNKQAPDEFEACMSCYHYDLRGREETAKTILHLIVASDNSSILQGFNVGDQSGESSRATSIRHT